MNKLRNEKGFTLIELMVAMFIFVLLMGAMVAVSVAGFRSYGKSKAIKTVTEDVGFALNSIAKDVRMGKIEKFKVGGVTQTGDGTNFKRYFAVTLNRDASLVCYYRGDDFLGSSTAGTPADPTVVGSVAICPSSIASYSNKIVDLFGSGMIFDPNSGFISSPTDTETAKIRGWAEINLNVVPTSGNGGMDTDQINLQTVVSSRDYGTEVAP